MTAARSCSAGSSPPTRSGAAAAALGAGVVRDTFGAYTYAWWGGAALCVVATLLSFAVRVPRARSDDQAPSPLPAAH